MDIEDALEWTVFGLVGAVVIGLVTFVGTAIYKNANTDGRVEFCHINHDSGGNVPYYRLTGYRRWSPDIVIERSTDRDRILEMAKLYGCPLK